MKKTTIKGIIARDTGKNANWQPEFETKVKDSGCGIMWKSQLSDINEILDELRNLISAQGYFDYYNIAKNKTNYHGKIVDFATKDDYPKKMQVWKKMAPAWFEESYDEYTDGKKKAKIVFLVEKFESIHPKDQIDISLFVPFNKQASRQNAVAYTDIITPNRIKQRNMINTIKELLVSNKNLILTGAPGTGKTYLAKQIAAQMILGKEYDENCEEDKKIIDEQCGFVQFHPSYDYTDFVEGLRPIQDENGNVGFERKDGVFKAFCAKAVEKFETKGFDEAFDKLLESVSDEQMTLKTTKGNEFAIAANSRGNLILFTGKNFQQNGVLTRERVKAEFLGKPMDQWWKSYYRGVADYLEREFNLKKVAASPNRPFVFIIDEINRGEISKIFGELFFSIDPSYRGEKKGRVQTQYQNLVEDGDVFKKGFYVPENVYIIGTMNDIDRSVESMDFAFRRRFAFKEIKADEEISISMLYSDKAWGKDNNGNSLKPDDNTINIIKEKMIRLNNVIWHKPIEGETDDVKSIEGLSSAYHIGASYFLKLANYKNNDGTYDFDMLWEYHLEGLLFEYLRGTTDIDKSMKRLAEAYGYTKSNKYETTSNH